MSTVDFDRTAAGRRLREARIRAGYRSIRLASQAGAPVPRDTIAGWECRGTEPGAFRLAELCAFYGVSITWVLGVADDGAA